MNSDFLSAAAAMAHKPRQSLRDYQRELAERTSTARESATGPSRRLGFLAAGHGWLISLSDAAEIMPLPPVTVVPGTRSWFMGVIHHRGKLTGVVDFERFLGHEPQHQKTRGRLIVLSDRFSIACSLRVPAVTGLMDLPSLSHAEPAAGKPRWQGPQVRIRDKEWQLLDIPALLADHRFADAALR